MKIKVFANTNKLHLLSRCSCHVFYQEIDLLAFALCYVDDFVLFKFYLFFIRVTDLIIFHANTDTIFFFLIILKRFLYSTHFLLYMYHGFFLNNYSVIFFFYKRRPDLLVHVILFTVYFGGNYKQLNV